MRVLHINSYYSASPFYKELFEHQRALGQQIQVFVPVTRGFNSGFDFGEYTKVCPDHTRFDRLLFHRKHKRILEDVQRQYDIGSFGVLHAHSLFSNGYIAMMLKRKYDIPYIVAVRNTDVNVFFARMPHLRALGRTILREAARVVFLSSPYRDAALRPYLSDEEMAALLEKSEVIPNGIDPFWLRHRASAPKAPKDTLALLSIGRADRNKNLPTAADAADILVARGHSVHYDMVLATIDSKQVLQRLRTHPCLTLHGRMDKEGLRALYQHCDILLMPSLKESFGLVCAEAMSQGLPVLYTRGQGFDGQFEDGEVGYAIDPRDPQMIAERIERVAADLGAISWRALERSARYDWARFAEQYMQIYREVGK